MKFDRFISVTPDQLERLQATTPEDQQEVFEAVIEERRAMRAAAFEQNITAPSKAEYTERLEVPGDVELPLKYLTPYLNHLDRWSEALGNCLAMGKADGAVFALEMVQAAVLELTLTMMEDGAPLRRVWLGDQGDMRSGQDADLEVVRIPAKFDAEEQALKAKLEAAFNLLEAGEPFNIEDLFGGDVPTFKELPDCGESPCPACDARREYFAHRQVH